MKTITFTCETITPMFLSGADGSTPELRPPSIKGALRFWWRAMNGGDWRTLKEQEDRIFGSTKEKALFSIQSGKADFKKVKQNSKTGLPNEYNQAFREGEPKADIFKYMAYGSEDRKFIQENNFTFNVIFTFYLRVERGERKELSLLEKENLRKAFYLLSYFGGLGAKNRNGFGAFRINTCVDENGNDVSQAENYTVLAKSLFINQPSSYTSFSKESLLFETAKTDFESYEQAFLIISKAYISARKAIDNAHYYDNRKYIASPIQQESSLPVDRHSKCYFLNIIKEGNFYKGIILHLPYNYLAEHPNQSISHSKNYKTALEKFNKELFNNPELKKI